MHCALIGDERNEKKKNSAAVEIRDISNVKY